MTDTVTAEQIAGLVEALEHSADLTRNESPYHTDPAETLYRQAAQALTALQERVEVLSAELEGLKKSIDGRQTINQPQCGTASATAEVCDQKRSTEFLALNGCKAASPILQQLIQRQYNVETWGLIGRLKAVEAAIKSSEIQSISPNVVSAGNSGLDTINTSQNHPSTNGEG